MHRYIILIIIGLFSFEPCDIKAQNLITNGSFETYTTTFLPQNWDALGSPDYFNTAFPVTSTWYNVPNSYFGYCSAKHGNAYMGFATYDSLNPNIREYPVQLLKQALEKDSTYCISFYVSRADGSEIATGNMGVLFTPVMPVLNIMMVTATPQLVWPSIITDTVNWVYLSQTYKANGYEQYITIGNFSDDATNPIQYIKPTKKIPFSTPFAYYYIDSVCLYKCAPAPPPPIDTSFTILEPTLPNVFTPNGDGVNDTFNFALVGVSNVSFTIYNRWGFLIHSEGSDSSPSGRLGGAWDGKSIQGDACPAGVYFYVLEYEDSKHLKHKKRGYITLMR